MARKTSRRLTSRRTPALPASLTWMVVAASASAGCHGCKDEKPYVPFTVGSGSSGSASPSAAPVDSAETASSGFAVVNGVAPSGDPRKFELGSATVSPRAGRVFKRGLVFEADGDQADDLFAWTEAGDGSKGELVYFHGGAKDATEAVLTKMPKELDIGQCSHETSLQRIGNNVITVSLSLECGDGKEKEQWTAVARVDPARDPAALKAPEVRLEARAKDPLALGMSTDDRDHDKMEDLVVSIALAGQKDKDRVEASLVLWDRPAGYAWDPGEPEASLGKLGQSLLNRAVAKKPDAVARAEAALSLVRALCTDVGGARFSSSAGAPKCQESRVFGDAVHAIAIAANNGGDLPRAVAASEMVAGLKFDHGRLPQIDALYSKKVKKVDASIARRSQTKASKSGNGILSPLAFDDAGGLLVAADDAVMRLDLATGEETKTEGAPWSRTVSWSSGDATIELAGASRPCPGGGAKESVGTRGTFADIELPVIDGLLPSAVKKDKCDRGRVEIAPIAIENDGAVLAVAGEVFRAKFGDQGVYFERAGVPGPGQGTSPTGAARSPDGKSTVIALPTSLLVLTQGGAERWRGSDVKGLSRCVVSSNHDRVACVADEVAVVLEPKAQKPDKAPKKPGKPAKKK